MGEIYKVPVGPIHIALEEPVYFKVHVHGETIEKVDILSGFVHRGMEIGRASCRERVLRLE